MVKTAEISVGKRHSVITLRKEGYSVRQIAGKLNISRNGVHNIIKRFDTEGRIVNKAGRGRKRCTSQQQDNYLRVSSLRERRLTSSDLTRQLNAAHRSNVSKSTVKRRLKEAGLRGCVAVRKPLLRPQNRRKRLQWAKEHASWTVQQWKRVLWTDESKFEVFGSHRRVYVRRRDTEKFHKDCVQPTVKHGGASVMVRGCFGGQKVGDIAQIKGIMRKEEYLTILQDHAIPSGSRILGRGFVFQQDNDPKHSSKLCKGYLEQKSRTRLCSIMDWPPQSPDLSPIELLWDELDRSVKNRQPTSAKQLWEFLQDEWNQIKGEYLEKLLLRMPRICAAVVKARGGYFDESSI